MADALRALTAWVRVSAAGFFEVNERGRRGNMVMSAKGTLATYGGSRQAAYDEYFRRFESSDPFAPTRFAGTTQILVSTEDIGGPQAAAHSSYLNEYLPRLGLGFQVGLFFRDGGRIVGGLVLFRAAGEPDFDGLELVQLRRAHALVESAYAMALERVTPADDGLLVEAGLTGREIDVVRLAATGASNADVARALVVSVGTVKTHLNQAYRKLGVRSRTQLALRLGASGQDEPDAAGR
jgi:DNA-binding CsgD family transcriptional regulator